MRQPITVTDQMRCALGCQGVTLESGSVEGEPSRSTVLVYRVDLSRGAVYAAPPVVKFSEQRHALPGSERLRLATPQYYHDYPEDVGGIRDEMEGQYQQNVRSLLATTGSQELLRRVPPLTGHVVYGVDGFWMFCTSIRPDSPWELGLLRRRFGAECSTTIQDPSAFARELGSAFAAHSTWSDVELSAVDMVMIRTRPPALGDKVVRVSHGPVHYADHAAELIDSFPTAHRTAVVPFVKRRTYAWQEEYRFTVSINGRARENELLIPIPESVRRLASIVDSSSS